MPWNGLPMKIIKLLAFHLLSFAVVVALPLQSAVNVRKEPRHLIKFANKYVRVIDASVRVGDATLFHTHDIDNVPVAITGGDLKTELLGQQGTFSTVATGAVSYARETYTHRITNVGNTDVRFIDAEILASPGNGTAAPPLENVNGLTMAIDNERVRIYRLILEPGQSTGLHTHNLSRLSVVVSKGKVAIETKKQKSQVVDFQPGEFQWHAGETTHTLKNIGTSRFEMVDIEWK
jgi:quercetin dioxygenase-like cupin family protein